MLKEKVVLITGASSGIGYSTAITLSKEGANIVAGARRTQKLDELKKEIENENGKIITTSLDVTKKEDCKSFAELALKEYGKIDILINNAGLMPLSFVKNLKLSDLSQNNRLFGT